MARATLACTRADAWLRPLRGRPLLARVAERVTGLPATVDFAGAATWLFNSVATQANALEDQPSLSRTAVVHPGIDDRLYRPAESRTWRWRLLYLGRIDERKGVHLAVDALAALPIEATLTIQGSGDARYIESLRERAAAAALTDRVAFTREPRERLPEMYAAADAVLCPVQWEEPWGLVPLEAIAVGRPVVATGTGGSREYLRHELNCLLYEPRDSSQALADAVHRLAGDEALRLRIREHGFETASRYTERAYNEMIESALDQAARKTTA